jgi:hypothetical protein
MSAFLVWANDTADKIDTVLRAALAPQLACHRRVMVAAPSLWPEVVRVESPDGRRDALCRKDPTLRATDQRLTDVARTLGPKAAYELARPRS